MAQAANNLFNFFNASASSNIYVYELFILIFIIIVSLRIIVCGGYQTQLTIFNLSAKDIGEKSAIKDTKSKLLNKVVKDFVKSSDKGISVLNPISIVKKHLFSLTMLGISYESLERFVSLSSNGFLVIGALLAFIFEDYRSIYALSTIVAFILFRLFETVFDFIIIKNKLELEMAEYVNREIGQFYGTDSSSVLIRLKSELSTLISAQTEALAQSITKMGDTTSGVLRLSLQEITREMEKTALSFGKISQELNEPAERWKNCLEEARNAQKDLNDTCHTLNSLMSSVVSGLTEQKDREAFEKQLKYIEKNQGLLEESINKYELSLEEMTQKMGDGFGKIVEFHIQQAYDGFSHTLTSNMQDIINLNNDMILKLQELFESMKQQSRSETQAILKIKEQMEIHFEK